MQQILDVDKPICLKCFTEISLSVTAMLASIFDTKLLQMMQLSLHQFLGLASMRLTLLKIILITASLMAIRCVLSRFLSMSVNRMPMFSWRTLKRADGMMQLIIFLLQITTLVLALQVTILMILGTEEVQMFKSLTITNLRQFSKSTLILSISLEHSLHRKIISLS